ncbi:MAG: M12 family metallo-peptidase [Planctomycetota bacterium]|jgi:hypothetical protein|nr:M12 family metallo-peptidase [Planctomycetota bacterium]MDP6940644.1 M12 family metallo-peptidase [Planctomycetota bacterium]
MHSLLTLLPLLAASAHGVDGAETNLDQHFFSWSVQSLELPATAGEDFQVSVVLDDVFDTELVLHPYSVRADNFAVWEQGPDGSLRAVAAPAISTYRGFIAGIPDSVVSANLHDGQLRASIFLGEGNGMRVIQPLSEFEEGAANNLHVIYDTAELVPDDQWVMAEPLIAEGSEVPHANGTSVPGSGLQAPPSNNPGKTWGIPFGVSPAPGTLNGSGNGSGRAIDKTVAIACDADFKFYQKNNNSTNQTVQDIEDIINDVEVIYQRDVSICWRVAAVVVRTSSSSDPYTSNNASTLLNQVQSEWNANQTHIARDVVQLFTGRSVSGSTIGIAWLGVVCKNGIHYSMVQSRYTSNWSRRVSLSAHELGHNWGADHCCSSSSCSGCHIMCPSNGGCSGNVSKFGSQSISSINQYRNNSAPCAVDGCGTGPTMTLSSPSPGTAGRYNKVTIKNGDANSSAFFLYSFNNNGTTSVPGCSGLSLDMKNASQVGTISLDQNGYGELLALVPSAVAGRTIYLQAADTSACTTSNLVTHTF